MPRRKDRPFLIVEGKTLDESVDSTSIVSACVDPVATPRAAAAELDAEIVAPAVERESRVYFIESATGQIKIGYSTDVDARIRDLGTGNPGALRVLFTTPGGRELEWRLHDRFAASRTKGEWFDPTFEILLYLIDAKCAAAKALGGALGERCKRLAECAAFSPIRNRDDAFRTALRIAIHAMDRDATSVEVSRAERVLLGRVPPVIPVPPVVPASAIDLVNNIELSTLRWIVPHRIASAIVSRRAAHGPFDRWAEVVALVGDRFAQKIVAHVIAKRSAA